MIRSERGRKRGKGGMEGGREEGGEKGRRERRRKGGREEGKEGGREDVGRRESDRACTNKDTRQSAHRCLPHCVLPSIAHPHSRPLSWRGWPLCSASEALSLPHPRVGGQGVALPPPPPPLPLPARPTLTELLLPICTRELIDDRPSPTLDESAAGLPYEALRTRRRDDGRASGASEPLRP